MRSENIDVTRWRMAGTRLDANAVADLEKQVASVPDNLEARVKILGYYRLKRIAEKPAQAASQPHILWMVRNRPEVATGPAFYIDKLLNSAHYKEVQAAWNEQIAKQANNLQILGNAAGFFLQSDSERSEKLLRQAQALEPKNPAWADQLGLLYSLNAMNGDAASKAANARKALESYEMALPGKDAKAGKEGDLRFYQLTTLAQAAYQAGEFTKAEAYAKELLETAPKFKADWNYGNAIYTGNSVLGLIALSHDNVGAARDYLLAASQTPGSPQLNSFGPDFILAKQLLERGEKETVLAALKNISKFWKSREDKLKEWQENISEGKMPDFDRTY